MRTKYLYEGLAETDSLRRLAEDYPDDPRIWYELGENLVHAVPPISGGFPRGLPEAERAFERAAKLDPEVAHYHYHLVHLAFILHRDSALAARRIEALPGNPIPFESAYQLSLDLVFGSASRREQAFRQIDTLAMEGTSAAFFDGQPRHPADGALREQMLRRFKDRGNLGSGQQTNTNL